MDTTGLLLGIDIGTTRTKAVVVDRAGRIVSVQRAPTPFELSEQGVQMSAEAFLGTLRSVVHLLGDARHTVQAVGIASMGETGAPIDGAGRIVGPLIAWDDPRGAEVAAHLSRAFGDELPARAGQATRTQSSIAKIGWFIEQGADVSRWLGVSELCLWRLTQAEATERSLACRTGAFDLVERCFMADVIRAVGARPDVFPAVLPAGAAAGYVTADGADWLGLSLDIPVTIAGHDHMVGAAAVGMLPGDLLDSVGTAETLVRYAGCRLDIPRAISIGADVSLRPAAEGLALMMGDLRPGRLITEASSALGDGVAEDLDALALSSDATVDGSRLLEQLRWHKDIEPSEGLAGPRWRGLLEAMSRYVWDSALALEGLTGRPDRLVLIGGGARSDVWAAAKRSLCGLPVVRWREEAVAFGAAMFAGAAAGIWPDLAAAPLPELEGVPFTERRPPST